MGGLDYSFLIFYRLSWGLNEIKYMKFFNIEFSFIIFVVYLLSKFF